MKEDRPKIGEILVKAGIIDEMQLIKAVGEQEQWGGRLCSIIVRLGFADEKSISAALGKQLKQKCISFDNIDISPETLKLVSLEIARKYNIIPVEMKNKVLTIAISDPLDLNTLDELSFRLGLMVRPVLAIDSAINKAISRFYEGISDKKVRPRGKLSDIPENLILMTDGIPTPHIPSFEKVLHEKADAIAPDIMVRALSEILIEKGLFTKEELMDKIRKKVDR